MFQTFPAPLTDISVTLPSSATTNQSVVILTDVQVAHSSIVCPITATLSPSASYISLSANYDTISVNAALMVSPTDNGTHLFTLTVNSSNFSGSVA